MTIYLTLQQFESKESYAFVNYGTPVICIAKNLKTWAEDEMLPTPDDFAKRVGGVISHESLHVVLDDLLNDGFEASSKLDNLFGQVYRDDDSVHGVWDLDAVFMKYGR